MKKIKTLLSIFILVGSSSLIAQDFYIGAGLGKSDLSATTNTTDKTQSSSQIFFGMKLNENFAVEAGHADLGNFSTNSLDKASVKYTTVGVINHFSKIKELKPFVQSGLRYIDSNHPSLIKNRISNYIGIGADFNIEENIDFRLSFNKYSSDTNSIFFGIFTRF